MQKDNSSVKGIGCYDTHKTTVEKHATPAAVEGGYVVEPATVEEMHARLDRILEACVHLQDLMRDRLHVTQREVRKLRKAFWIAMGKPEKHLGGAKPDSQLQSFTGQDKNVEKHGKTLVDGGEEAQAPHAAMEASLGQQDAKTAACDRALRELEEYVNLRPQSLTYDMDLVDEDPNKGWNFTALCPLINTPFERRLQTLLVSLFTFFTLIPVAIGITVILLINKWTMPLMVMYLVYIFTLGRPAHPLKKRTTFTRLKLWNYYSDYFPVRLVIPDRVRRQFDASGNYFFVYHPHGIHGFGAIVKFSFDAALSSLLPGITVHLQTLKINFFLPFWRELAVLCGCGDASADCIRRTLRSGPGESVMLVVGGAQESMLARPNTNELTLRNRKGFVRIALEEGTPLVPVYAFGENDVYRVSHKTRSEGWKRVERVFRKATSIAFPVFLGRGWFNYGFGPLPHRRPIVVVVGEPMPVPKIPQPSPEDLLEWHNKYMDALRRLFDEYRGVYDVDSSDLYIH